MLQEGQEDPGILEGRLQRLVQGAGRALVVQLCPGSWLWSTPRQMTQAGGHKPRIRNESPAKDLRLKSLKISLFSCPSRSWVDLLQRKSLKVKVKDITLIQKQTEIGSRAGLR